MPFLSTRAAGFGVTDVEWNEIITDLNSLTAVATGYSGRFGIGTLTPSRQLQVYGLGQTTSALADSGNVGGTIYLQDAAGSTGNGGAVLFGAVTGHFAALKSTLYDAGGTTTGDLVVSLRRTNADAALTEVLRFGAAGAVYLNDTANMNMTLGLTLNQGSGDFEILAFKSSDVAHTMTALAESDTYGNARKYDATAGGLAVTGFGESAVGAVVNGYGTGTDGTHTTAGLAAVVINGGQWDGGTGVASLTTAGNLCVFQNFGVTRFILGTDGDSWQDVGTAWTNFDDYDDVTLLTALSAAVSRADDPVRAQFADVLEDNRDAMARAKVVDFNEDGHHFVNWSRMSMLLVGAVRQLSGTVQVLEGRLKALEA